MNSFNKQENDGAGLRNGDSEDNSDDSNCSKEDVLSNCSSRPDTPQPRCGKKTRGRVKIQMEFIQNKLRRYTTFSKRKSGIMKKAHELATLTGTQVMLLVASETGHVYTFATRKLQPMLSTERGKQLIQTCLNSPDPVEANTSSATHNMDEQRMSAQGFEEPELSYVPPPEGNKDLFKNCDISYPATSPIQQHLLSIQQQPPEIGNKEIVQKACDYLQQFKNNSQQIHHQQIKQEELMSQQTSPPAGCLPMNLVRRGGPNDNNNSNDQQHNNNKSTITNHSALFSHPSMVPTASSRHRRLTSSISPYYTKAGRSQQQSSDGEVRLQLNSCSPSHDNDQHISRTAAIRLDSEPPKIAVVNTYTMLRQPTQSNLCGSGYSPLIHSSSVNLIGGGHDNQQHGGSRDSSPARKRLKR